MIQVVQNMNTLRAPCNPGGGDVELHHRLRGLAEQQGRQGHRIPGQLSQLKNWINEKKCQNRKMAMWFSLRV